LEGVATRGHTPEMPHLPEPASPRSDLARLFRDDERLSTRLGPGVTVCRWVASVNLPSGRLVAQDPYMNGEPAFEEGAQPGLNRVYVSGVWLDGGTERVSAAMVVFDSETLPRLQRGEVRWRVARRKVSGTRDPFRFGVDYATAAFMDEDVARWLSEKDPARESIGAWLEMAGSGSDIKVPGCNGNLVAFSAGAGDGAYTSWWGVDEAGRRLCLAIDFELLVEETRPLVEHASLFSAVKSGDVASVRSVSMKKTELGCEPHSGLSPLHWATHAGLLDVVRALLERGANPNLKLSKDEALWRRYLKGATALHIAAERGHAELVQALLAAGAAPSTASNQGLTPLHLAVRAGHGRIVSALLQAGADAGAQTRGDLWQECFSGFHSRGTTALHLAAAAGHSEMVSELLRAGAPVDSANHAGLTPLHLAAQLQRREIVEQLLSAGARADVLCKEGTTPLWRATYTSPEIEEDVVAIIRALVATGAVRKEAAFGNTALHRAAIQGAVRVIQALLDAGFDPNDSSGRMSPLAFAAAEGELEAVKLLVQAGARVDERGKLAPREVALRNNHPEVVLYLAQAQASTQAAPEAKAKPPLIRSARGPRSQ
jgi:ankyrin repeat protein